MVFTIVTHVLHKRNSKGEIGGYGPYVREMNIWFKHVSKVVIVAPIQQAEFDAIDIAYEHPEIEFIAVPQIDFTSSKNILKSVLRLPRVMLSIFRGMNRADHVHLRCPGNMGLLGGVAQIFYPNKSKSAKYAGNWDWNSEQPTTYRWQQKLLLNTTFTKRMTALVYGNWTGNTHNIKPFFTATYSDKDIVETPIRDFATPLRLLFVGTLSSGKRPLLSAEVAAKLIAKGYQIEMVFLGEGEQRSAVEDYVNSHNIRKQVILRGNVSSDTVREHMCSSHFLVFASNSEGWPKAVAEAMFWGCLPITTRVSCVADMLGDGKRGSLVNADSDEIASEIEYYLENPKIYQEKVTSAMNWSRQYTMEYFESEIKKIVKCNS